MKLREIARHQLVTKFVEGEEVQVREKVIESVPRIPFNRDAMVRKGMFYIASVFTVFAVAWGAGAIGWMLAHLVPAWIAYPASCAYDVAWVYFLSAEWTNRYDEEKADKFRKVGWVTLMGSAFGIVWHAHMIDMLVVGIVGALLTLVVKGMWAAYMSTGRVKLSPEYQALLKKRREEAYVREALALSDRDKQLKEDEIHRLRLALAYERGESPITVDHVDQAVEVADRSVDQGVQEVGQAPDLRMVQAGPVRSASSDQSSDQVQILVDRLRSGEKVTKRSAAELLKVSPTTAQRRLSEAKAIVEDGTGQYL